MTETCLERLCWVRRVGLLLAVLAGVVGMGSGALAQPGFCDPPPSDDAEPNNSKFEASLAPPGDPLQPFDRAGFFIPDGGSIVAIQGCTRGSFLFDNPNTGGQSRTQDYYLIRIAADPNTMPGTIVRYRLQIESIGFDNNAFRGDFMGLRQTEGVVLGADFSAQRTLGVEFAGVYPFVMAPTSVWYAPADVPHDFFYRVFTRAGASDLSIGTGEYQIKIYRDGAVIPPLMNTDFQAGRITIDLQRAGDLGACCNGLACVVLSAPDCAAGGGSFRGPGTSCTSLTVCTDPVQQPDPRGDNSNIWILDSNFRPIPNAENDDGMIVGSGRCCLAGGLCAVLPLDECAAQGGVWDSTPMCASDMDLACSRAGICCVGSCACTAVLVRPGDCPSGRWFEGMSTSCVPGLCDQGLGGCCLPDSTDPMVAGRCVVVTIFECFQAGGVYRGDTLGCRPDVCPATPTDPPTSPTGTCLIGAGPGVVGSCMMTTREACESLPDGRYLGDGSLCEPVTSRVVLGACCRGDGSCISTLAPDPRTPSDDRTRCNGISDTWRPGMPCFPHPCPIFQYAACCSGTSCTIVTEADCTSVLAGIWLPLVVCEPTPCGDLANAVPDQPKSRLVRQLGPGTYYLAVADADLSTYLPSAPDDQFRSGAVLDFRGPLVSGQTGPRVTDFILRADSERSLAIADRLGRVDLISGIERSNPYDIAFVRFTVAPLNGAPALMSTATAVPDVLATDGTGIFVAEVTVTPGTDPPSTGLFGELIDPIVSAVRIPLFDDGFPPDRCAGDGILTALVLVREGAGPPGPLDVPYTIGDQQGRTGSGFLRITLLAGPPGNNRCDTAIDVGVGTHFGDNQLATTDTIPICESYQIPRDPPRRLDCPDPLVSSRDVWYRFTALTAGDYEFDLTASTKELLTLSLHDSCSPPAEVCSCVCDPASIVFPRIVRTLGDGEVVLIRVACCFTNSVGGPFQLRIGPVASESGACCRTGGVCEVVINAAACPGAFSFGAVCTPGACTTVSGACCFPSGACGIRFEGDCIEARGEWTANAVCGTVPCPPPGACCGFDGTCFNAFQQFCVSPNVWAGGVPCSPTLCPPGGACCTGALCTVVIQTECPAGSTWFQNALCEPTSPCEPVIACCASNSICFPILRSLCLAPSSPSSSMTCSPDPCGVLGVCCRTARGAPPTCSLATFFECTSRSSMNTNPGVWVAGAACSPTACLDVGRCCRIDGTCALGQFQSACENAGGTWTRASASVTCAVGACPPSGACCLSSGSCTVRTQLACGVIGGQFTVGGMCMPNPCPTTGACCIRGVCSVRTIPDCEAADGIPQMTTTCTAMLCPPFGACCVPTAPSPTCLFVAQADCTAAGARWVPGSSCSPSPCPTAGACCAGPACVINFRDECTPDAAFNPFSVCTPDPCGGLAACCVVGQACALTTRAVCTGVWSASLATCSPDPCVDPGRCCGVDGTTATATCTVLTRAECPVANFTVSGTCTPNDCPLAGSCCLTTGACTVTTLASCSVSRAWTSGMVCGPTTCTTIGTCCRLGVCSLVVLGECVIDPDGNWTTGTVCDPNPCPPPPPPGYCCVGARCLVGTPTDCVRNVLSTTAGAVFVPSPTAVCNASGNVTTPCCYADYNKSGAVGSQDIFDFLVDYFASTPDARVGGDGTGTPSVQDIFDFLEAFINGCAPTPATGRCCVGALCTIVPQSSCSAVASAGAVFTPSVSTCNTPGDFVTPCCFADYNKIGGLTIQDVFDFLTDFFANQAPANVGGDGTTPPSVQDIFDFLTAYFNGGC